MPSGVRIFSVKQQFSPNTAVLSTMSKMDICVFRFVGGNASETERLTQELYRLRMTGALLIGMMRFPFRFEGKRRMEAAVRQYYVMSELCDGITYLWSEGATSSLPAQASVDEMNRWFYEVEDVPVQALNDMVYSPGDVCIDAEDIRSFVRTNKGALYIHTVERESFDEPMKDILRAAHLPIDYAEASKLCVNLGFTKDVDIQTFQQLNLRIGDLFHKADVEKVARYPLNEEGRKFRITILAGGLDHPFSKPENAVVPKMTGFWLKDKLAGLVQLQRQRRVAVSEVATAVAEDGEESRQER